MTKLFHCQNIVKILVRHYSHSNAAIRVRFAPSPTGYLHLGGLRTALYNYLFARSRGGQFILRIEDTDQSRLVPGAAQQLEDVLSWIGIIPDESPVRGGDYGPYFQSQRREIYAKYAQELIDKGLAYRCFCSEKRLDLLRREANRTKQPNKYDRRCYKMSLRELDQKLSDKQPFTVRFLLSQEVLPFNDTVYGEFTHDVFATEGDPVIMKSDGFPTYHFANVVDDHLMRITHVLRGVEWQVSTPKHLMMYQALGWEPPQFGHLPLIMNNDGTKLSKRQGDLHLESLRRVGYSPDSVLNFVTLVGGGFEEKDNSADNVYNLEELSSKFNISRMNTNNCKIDLSKLDQLNRTILKNSLEDTDKKQELLLQCREIIVQRMNDLDLVLDNVDDDTVEKNLVWAQDRISKLSDIVSDDLLFLWHLPDKDKISVKLGANILEEIIRVIHEHSEDKVLMKHLKQLSKSHGIKFPELMKDLRLIITGKSDGPPVTELVHILGSDKVMQRLSHFTNN